MEKKNWNLIVPSVILFDNNLSSTEKILLSLIHSLSNETGYCYASNKYLSEVFNMNKVALSNILTHLENKQYIIRSVERNEKKQIVKRGIKIKIEIPIYKKMNRGITQNSNDTIHEKMKENKDIINNIKIVI